MQELDYNLPKHYVQKGQPKVRVWDVVGVEVILYYGCIGKTQERESSIFPCQWPNWTRAK